MDIKTVLSQMITTLETQEKLAPIETAVERMEAELERVTDEVEALQAKGDALKQAEEQAAAIVKSAEMKKAAADIYYDDKVGDADLYYRKKMSEISQEIKKAQDEKKEIETEVTGHLNERLDYQRQAEAAKQELRELEELLPILRKEVQDMRRARAELIMQARSDV